MEKSNIIESVIEFNDNFNEIVSAAYSSNRIPQNIKIKYLKSYNNTVKEITEKVLYDVIYNKESAEDTIIGFNGTVLDLMSKTFNCKALCNKSGYAYTVFNSLYDLLKEFQYSFFE